MLKRTIIISEDLRLFVVNPVIGEIEVPIKRVEDVEKHAIDRGLCVYFQSKDGHEKQEMCLDVSLPLYYVQEHMDEQNEKAEKQAIKRGFERLDRYEIKSMSLERIYINGSTLQLYFEWTDCYGNNRAYYGEICEIKEGANVDYYASYKHKATFFF